MVGLFRIHACADLCPDTGRLPDVTRPGRNRLYRRVNYNYDNNIFSITARLRSISRRPRVGSFLRIVG